MITFKNVMPIIKYMCTSITYELSSVTVNLRLESLE